MLVIEIESYTNLSIGFVFLGAIGDFERISLFFAEMHSRRFYS